MKNSEPKIKCAVFDNHASDKKMVFMETFIRTRATTFSKVVSHSDGN